MRRIKFSATGGSTLGLPGLTTTQGYYGINASASGASSVINLSGLTSIGGPYSATYFSGTGGGTIELGSGLTTLNNVGLTIDSPTGVEELASGVETPALPLIGTFTDGTITLIGSDTFTLGMTTLDGTSIYAQSGAVVNLDVASYSTSGPSSYYGEPRFEATGGSTLDFISLSSVTGYYGLSVTAQGPGSTISLLNLTTDAPTYTYSPTGLLSATDGGAIDLSTGLDLSWTASRPHVRR